VENFTTSIASSYYTALTTRFYKNETVYLLWYGEAYTSDHNKKVKCYLVVDEEFRTMAGNNPQWPGWQSRTIIIFENMDDPFEQKFGIDWQISRLDGSWESPNYPDNIYDLWKMQRNT